MWVERDRAVLAKLLRRDPLRHVYQLGDLDDFFWPYTTWFRRGDQVVLLYGATSPPTLLAFGRPERVAELGALLTELAPSLPERVYAHLSPGLVDALAGRYRVDGAVAHRRLALTDVGRLAGVRADGTVLTETDLPELVELYAAAYPDNWFDPRMLETGQYVGVRVAGQLAAVAGVHVWSPVYRVAALGNVATRPEFRGRGFGSAVVAALCTRLRDSVDHVALNVRADNVTALRLYERLGFTPVDEYGEFPLTAWGSAAAG
ncbi:GNAT family N-acetyltransferase [Micromonospora pallida]|uniref:GNAT family N-acetyltransferase n=1 Tax=Micromonospora pallida TaxID=145854 RepID=UPI001FDFB4AE|nr:GNAT family N-acetyltransferase [Micromonospora pallida]